MAETFHAAALVFDLDGVLVDSMPAIRAYWTDWARRRGVPAVDGSLREVGLPPRLFDAIVDGTQVTAKKPAPDIFLAACRRLSLPPPACIVVEDAVAGVAAAKAAGARCIALTTSFDATLLAGADWIAPDLSDVPEEALEW